MNEAVISCCKAFNNLYQKRIVFPPIETQSVGEGEGVERDMGCMGRGWAPKTLGLGHGCTVPLKLNDMERLFQMPMCPDMRREASQHGLAGSSRSQKGIVRQLLWQHFLEEHALKVSHKREESGGEEPLAEDGDGPLEGQEEDIDEELKAQSEDMD